MARDPYCSNCGYTLAGLTDSSKCPECGRPLVEVLERGPAFTGNGRRFTSPVVLFGLPLISIAFGPHENERFGKARGIIAFGDIAVGWLAIGGQARGISALGGFAIGWIALGGWAIGGLAVGGGAIGLIAVAGGAMGGLAMGGGTLGIIAEGGGAIGWYASGGGVWGVQVVRPGRADPPALVFFDALHRWVGGGPTAGLRWGIALIAWVFGIVTWVAAVLAALLAIAYYRQRARLGPRAP